MTVRTRLEVEFLGNLAHGQNTEIDRTSSLAVKIGIRQGSVCPQNSSKTARDRAFQAKSKKLNIFETVQNRDKVTKSHSYEIVHALSELASL